MSYSSMENFLLLGNLVQDISHIVNPKFEISRVVVKNHFVSCRYVTLPILPEVGYTLLRLAHQARIMVLFSLSMPEKCSS